MRAPSDHTEEQLALENWLLDNTSIILPSFHMNLQDFISYKLQMVSHRFELALFCTIELIELLNFLFRITRYSDQQISQNNIEE